MLHCPAPAARGLHLLLTAGLLLATVPARAEDMAASRPDPAVPASLAPSTPDPAPENLPARASAASLAADALATPPDPSALPTPSAPPDPSAPPRPQWITRDAFDRQLEKVHRGTPDPAIGLFGPGSMMWRITAYIEPGGLATGRAILMHISHPWIAAGINDHSKSRDKLLERGRETFSYALIMVYGSREQALQAAEDVRALHDHVSGTLPEAAGDFAAGSEYRANEVEAMLWVHATMWESMMIAYELVNGPVSADDKDRLYEEAKLFAYLFGIPESALPADWNAMIAWCDAMRAGNRIVVTPQAKELASFLYSSHGLLMWLPMKYNKLVTTANIPPDMRVAYGFRWGPWREATYVASIDTVRLAHWILPNGLLENPVQREAMARIRGERAGWFTRWRIRAALGRSELVQ